MIRLAMTDMQALHLAHILKDKSVEDEVATDILNELQAELKDRGVEEDGHPTQEEDQVSQEPQ